VNNAATAPSLLRMLDDVAAWREQAGREAEAALAAIAAEEDAVARAALEAERRKSALAAIRREEEERLASLDDAALQRKRTSVRTSLELDRALLEERAAALRRAQAERDAEAALGLDHPSMERHLLAWLEARAAAAAARETDAESRLARDVRQALAPYIDVAHGPPPSIGLPCAGVGVLVSADPPVGVPEAFVMVLPVPEAVYTQASARAEDLCTLLAYRLVAALYRLLGELDAAGAPVRFETVQGNLTIQVWLGDQLVPDDLRERAMDAVAAAVDGAPELAAAGLEVYAVWLTPDLLAEALT
jgi:hypothetical protein